jgi:hypothetical protein
MKNFNMLRFAVIFAFLGILFSSCTKDSLTKSGNQASLKNSTNDPEVTTGSIQASIFATGAVHTSMVVTNDEDGTEYPEVIADENGAVIINDLPEGRYTVVFHAYMPIDGGAIGLVTDVNDVTMTMNGVFVVADQVTDLGKIEFQ